MKIKYQTGSGRVSVEVEGDTQKDIFKQLSAFQEIFDESSCKKCSSENLRFVVRTIDENEYYEIRCADCGARLEFGQTKKGGMLFPRRKDKDGEWLPDGGWVKWNTKTKSLE
jgi:DNA-directed RNA polymerase subunit RPC12/RpoP